MIRRKLILCGQNYFLGHKHFRLGPPSPWTSALAAGKERKKKNCEHWVGSFGLHSFWSVFILLKPFLSKYVPINDCRLISISKHREDAKCKGGQSVIAFKYSSHYSSALLQASNDKIPPQLQRADLAGAGSSNTSKLLQGATKGQIGKYFNWID